MLLDIMINVHNRMKINANMNQEDFPSELLSKASALKIVSGHSINREKVVKGVLDEIEDVYFKYLEDKDFQFILNECRKHSVTLGKRVKVILRDLSFNGKAIDFDCDGSLLVMKDDETIIKVISEDVSVRSENGYV